MVFSGGGKSFSPSKQSFPRSNQSFPGSEKLISDTKENRSRPKKSFPDRYQRLFPAEMSFSRA
jgi:hypothetical protein